MSIIGDIKKLQKDMARLLKVVMGLEGGAGVTDHGALTGLTPDDDHPQYLKTDGTRAVTGTMTGVAPTSDLHLATKKYVDDKKLDDPAAPDDNTDLDASTAKHGLMMKYPNASPPTKFLREDGTFADPPGGAGGSWTFADTFGDASLYKAWTTHKTDAGRTIVESGGVLTISISAGWPADWYSGYNESPKAYIGIPQIYCVAQVKIDSMTLNDGSMIGFAFGHMLDGVYNATVKFLRAKFGGHDGFLLAIVGVGDYWVENSMAVPIYLRMTISGAGGSSKVTCAYSSDGSSWTDHTTVVQRLAPLAASVGLMAGNTGSAATVVAFDDFSVISEFVGPG